MSVNDEIFDRIVQHMADVRLYEEGVQIQNRRILRRHRKRLGDLLQKDIKSDVSSEIKRFFKEIFTFQKNSLLEFSTSQLDFHSDNLYKEVRKFYDVKRPTARELLAEITGPNIKGPSDLSKNLSNIASGELVRIQSKVRAGLANGSSPKEIIKEILKTTNLTEVQARALTRTSITATQTEALKKVVEENREIMKGFMFTAILDSRTSPICTHHNGKIYDIDDKRFQPPLHWNCRSSLIPVLKSKEELLQTGTNNLRIFGEKHTPQNVRIVEKRVQDYNPKVVYHEFYEDPETIAWAKNNNYILRKGDLSYAEKEALIKKYGGATEQFQRDREAFMYSQIQSADNSVRNAFIMGNNHVFDKDSVIFKDKTISKVSYNGKRFNSISRINKDKLSLIPDIYFNGIAPRIQSFTDWLKRQTFEVQTKILGSEDKANLFRGGAIKAREFVTPEGKALSIETLRNRVSGLTNIFRDRTQIQDMDLKLNVARPSDLMRSSEQKSALQRMLILDASDNSKTMSLTDYKGTSLIGKQNSRRRSRNEFDERNYSVNPVTGEISNNLFYEPDFNLYQERIDFMKASKDLTLEQKDFIENFVSGLQNKMSVNQQTVAIENLRVVFQRFNSSKNPWQDFSAVMRAENRFSVQNVSRLLDTRSRKRTEFFGGYLSRSRNDIPQVQLLGKYYNLDEIVNNQIKDQKYIDQWRAIEANKIAKRALFRLKGPAAAYLRTGQSIVDGYKSLFMTREQFINRLRKSSVAFDSSYRVFKNRRANRNKLPSDDWITQQIATFKSIKRRILDLEFSTIKDRPTAESLGSMSRQTLTKAIKLVASGRSTDYDSLAINIGKMYAEDLGRSNLFRANTLKHYHAEGSRLLKFMEQQKLIKVSRRSSARRGVWDVDTGRASGAWGDTVSYEVNVIDKQMLKLQEAEARVEIARRMGITHERDMLYVRAGNKEFYDAYGNKTSIPVVSRDKYADYDPKQIDRDIARALNHASNTQYEMDPEFFNFMDDVVRFRDPRGNSKYYDDINEFRHEILKRGEQGYGLMAAGRYHTNLGKPFKTRIRIDSRGRIYHKGYLTPTGGELVRPFLNSAQKVGMTPAALDELQIQLGVMIGSGQEALTQSGRRSIFLRHEKEILELGKILTETTQRDRRIREFLEHPLIKGHKAKEVPKMARLALEYYRIHKHVDGNFNNLNLLKSYKTQLMIENDASSSGAQIIALSTGDRAIAQASNVLATPQKNRLYDLVAIDTINDPEFRKIPAFRDANLTWEDLAGAAKKQNMVTFYGAGEATKAARVAEGLSEILEDLDYVVITKNELNPILRKVDYAIKEADKLGAVSTVSRLKAFRSELVNSINNNRPVGRTLLLEAEAIHPDVEDFVLTLTNTRKGLLGPQDFSTLSKIMTNNLQKRAPITGEFINFWKKVAKIYVQDTKKVDIPWVTFDGKIMMQRYRGKSQERIEFIDPVTGRKVANIYEGTVSDGNLRGSHAFQDASIGLGVNGNHSNDAVIVRQFHNWGRKNNIGTGTIHDAFFTNIGHADSAKKALRTIYADALGGDTVRKTLEEMRRQGLSYFKYLSLLNEAKKRGLINPKDKITRKDILSPIKEGEDWYGIGP